MKESKKITVHLNMNLKESILLFAASIDQSPDLASLTM
jgi:hypothetical protein